MVLIYEALSFLKWLECFGSSKLLSEKPLYALCRTLHLFSVRESVDPSWRRRTKAPWDWVCGFLMTLPVQDTANNSYLFPQCFLGVFVWPHAEVHGCAVNRPGNWASLGEKVVSWFLIATDRYLSSSHHGQRSRPVLLFPEFLQLSSKHRSSLNC